MVLKHNGTPIANQVVFARNIFSKVLGLMLRKSIPEDFAMVFPFNKPTTAGIHMLFMRFPIDAIFLDSGKTITGIAYLKPWTGHKQMKKISYIIEMNSGTLNKYGLNVGDTLDF